MSAIEQITARRYEPAPSEATAERAFLLWIGLYAILVILLVGHHVFGQGLPLIDGYGRLAAMQPVSGLDVNFAPLPHGD